MIETQAKQEDLRGAIKSLRDKANMLATCHSVLADRYSTWNTICLSVILSFSTLSTGIVLISEAFVQRTVGIPPDLLKWISGLASILTFLSGLLLSQWGWAGKASNHQEAVRDYFLVVNLFRQLLAKYH